MQTLKILSDVELGSWLVEDLGAPDTVLQQRQRLASLLDFASVGEVNWASEQMKECNVLFVVAINAHSWEWARAIFYLPLQLCMSCVNWLVDDKNAFCACSKESSDSEALVANSSKLS